VLNEITICRKSGTFVGVAIRKILIILEKKLLVILQVVTKDKCKSAL